VESHTLKLETATTVPLRVPREDGQVFVYPERESWVELVAANRRLLNGSDVRIQGRSLSDLRLSARREVWQAAVQFTDRLAGWPQSSPPSDLDTRPLVMAGHQPELYHAGVWLKNFALAWAARRCDGLAVNLVVDNDLLPGVGVRVPSGPADALRVDDVPFDAPHPRQPWEEAAVLDEGVFERFADRVAAVLADWDVQPVVTSLWPAGVAARERTDRLADRLVAARLWLERAWGVCNAEVPISHVCRLRSFRLFFCHVVAHLPRFRELHNELLRQYRWRHKLRSKTHPVPELKEQDGWLEAPFWLWRAGESTRRHLFVTVRNGTVSVGDGQETLTSFPLEPDGPADPALEALDQLERQGVRVRPRALTTTLFCRLLVADVFIHGIGGAKYDELTDGLMAQFFGLQPPAVIAVTGTLHLPGPEPYRVTEDDARQLRRLLRDLTYNPQRHVELSELPEPERVRASQLVQQKQQLIEQQHAARTTGLSRRERRARFQANYQRYQRFRQVNQELAPFVLEKRRRVERELAEVERQLAANAVLRDRQYAFCLFPEEKLRRFVGEFL